jgi:hypothetical protein
MQYLDVAIYIIALGLALQNINESHGSWLIIITRTNQENTL